MNKNVNVNLNEFFRNLFKKKNGDGGNFVKDTRIKPDAIAKAALLTILIMFINFFFSLPSLSPMSMSLYAMIVTTLVIFTVLVCFFSKGVNKKLVKRMTIAVVVIILIPFILLLASSKIFRSKSYAKLINVQEGVFAEDISRVKIDNVPIVDRESAVTIGQKQMGSMSDLVSQFEIDNNYTQINIKGHPYRVSPLGYSDLFKYISNNSKGIPSYIRVDMNTQDAELVKLNKPIMYSKSDILMRDLSRKLRFQFPFAIFGETNFEVDDEGEAYYITGVNRMKIGFFNGEDTVGAILTNANTGESKYYDLKDVPAWVDRVVPSDLIISQLDMHGLYSGGFINSLFGQKNVTKTSQGYNYISMDNDVYLYTGVTSVRSDDSNIGFYYVNLRTKEAKFYRVSSVSETAAMETAKGQVQEKGYKPTFPILLNINNRPVYFLSLKDNSNLAKMYALIDAENYQNVYVGYSVAEAMKNYGSSTDTSMQASKSSVEREITIEDVTSAVIDGNTVYFIKAKGEDIIYVGTAKKLGAASAFLKSGDTIKVFGNPQEKQFDILELR